MRISCNGCRVLRKGCNQDCTIRPCLQWIKSADSQANATLFLAKFYGRAGLLNLIESGPDHLRPGTHWKRLISSLMFDYIYYFILHNGPLNYLVNKVVQKSYNVSSIRRDLRDLVAEYQTRIKMSILVHKKKRKKDSVTKVLHAQIHASHHYNVHLFFIFRIWFHNLHCIL